MSESQFPAFVRPEPGTRTWRITLADGTARAVEATGFRVDHGALVMVLPIGNAMALAPGHWLAVGPAAGAPTATAEAWASRHLESDAG